MVRTNINKLLIFISRLSEEEASKIVRHLPELIKLRDESK